jgi:hypothetical protein
MTHKPETYDGMSDAAHMPKTIRMRCRCGQIVTEQLPPEKASPEVWAAWKQSVRCPRCGFDAERMAEEDMTKAAYDGMTGAEFMRAVGDDVDKWTEAAMEGAARYGMTVDRDWLHDLLADAMDAARRFSRPVVPVNEDTAP